MASEAVTEEVVEAAEDMGALHRPMCLWTQPLFPKGRWCLAEAQEDADPHAAVHRLGEEAKPTATSQPKQTIKCTK